MSNSKTDMTGGEFKKAGDIAINWISNYINKLESFPVLSGAKPGDIKNKISDIPPEGGASIEKIISDLDEIILPGITHWAHPSFFGYFASSGSTPGVLADAISAALNANGMLWKTSPALTELEERVFDWLKAALKLPSAYKGVAYDAASTSSYHGIAAAREKIDPDLRLKGATGRKNSLPLRLYCSEFAHSSIIKAALALGVGYENVVQLETDDAFSAIPEELEKAIIQDKKNGYLPFCAAASIGTTSFGSVDPVKKFSEICKKYNLWLHVDAAYAGSAAILPEKRNLFEGWEEADSIVVNPHKWLFTPIDFSAFFIKEPDILKRAFSLTPEYLKTAEEGIVDNLMDYGIPLGRRFRALKIWFLIRYFGLDGLRSRLRRHIECAEKLSAEINRTENFKLFAPAYFSLVCFRFEPEVETDQSKINELNMRLMNEINEEGKIFFSHTKYKDKAVLRLAIGGIRTEERHVEEAWKIIKDKSKLIT